MDGVWIGSKKLIDNMQTEMTKEITRLVATSRRAVKRSVLVTLMNYRVDTCSNFFSVAKKISILEVWSHRRMLQMPLKAHITREKCKEQKPITFCVLSN